jgi:hypothetical protein
VLWSLSSSCLCFCTGFSLPPILRSRLWASLVVMSSSYLGFCTIHQVLRNGLLLCRFCTVCSSDREVWRNGAGVWFVPGGPVHHCCEGKIWKIQYCDGTRLPLCSMVLWCQHCRCSFPASPATWRQMWNQDQGAVSFHIMHCRAYDRNSVCQFISDIGNTEHVGDRFLFLNFVM